ncbi:hypothetical protein F4804DRAFT_333704 [Jackrogersella minutella]|nr:hypothetical protein F4804DRAFT_333704 [Jackrogersella minutella]
MEDARQQIIWSTAICMALSLITLVMRIASRRVRQSKLLVSDCLAIGAFIISWAAALSAVTATRPGLGLHVELVPLPNLRQILLHIFVSEILYGIGFTLIKLSIISLYRQIFPTRLIFVSAIILGVVVLMWGTAVVLVSIFSCNPIQGFWDPTAPSKCVSTKWFFIGLSIPNILTDAVLLCLPMRDV